MSIKDIFTGKKKEVKKPFVPNSLNKVLSFLATVPLAILLGIGIAQNTGKEVVELKVDTEQAIAVVYDTDFVFNALMKGTYTTDSSVKTNLASFGYTFTQSKLDTKYGEQRLFFSHPSKSIIVRTKGNRVVGIHKTWKGAPYSFFQSKLSKLQGARLVEGNLYSFPAGPATMYLDYTANGVSIALYR